MRRGLPQCQAGEVSCQTNRMMRGQGFDGEPVCTTIPGRFARLRGVGLILLLGCMLTGDALAVDPAFPTNTEPSDIEFLLGTPQSFPHLGFGWTRKTEYHAGRPYAWIRHMEADLHFETDDTADAELWLRAAPLYLVYRRQIVALYINGHLVKEWVCSDDPEYHDYYTTMPGKVFREGANTLTLRMGHRKRGGDSRELSLAVDRILLRRKGPPRSAVSVDGEQRTELNAVPDRP